jgi:hypothetical protein
MILGDKPLISEVVLSQVLFYELLDFQALLDAVSHGVCALDNAPLHHPYWTLDGGACRLSDLGPHPPR